MTRLSTNKNNHPSNVITRIQDLIAGFQKIASTEQFDVLGTVSAQPALVTELQGLLVPWTSAEDAELAAKKAREARNAVETSTVKRLAAIEESVVSHYGKTSPDLVAFGLSPTKPRKKQSPGERRKGREDARGPEGGDEGDGDAAAHDDDEVERETTEDTEDTEATRPATSVPSVSSVVSVPSLSSRGAAALRTRGRGTWPGRKP